MSPPEKPDEKFEKLLEYLRQSRGFDFGAYKSPSLKRRIAKRMRSIKIARYPDYVDYLEVHPEEFSILFNTILINITAFFRDPPAWEYLSDTIIPRIIAGKAADEPIRVWSAGCASGEEVYSIAILLAEALGRNEFRKRAKIYATDVDEEALTTARQATYTAEELSPVADNLREKYFDIVKDSYVFKPELRRVVIFGRHDLVQDAPISRLDLLVCRNTFMYFNTETQNRVLGRFNYALNASGFLFLGKSEMLLARSALFTPVDLKHRIFAKCAPMSLRDRLLVFTQTSDMDGDLNNHVSGNALIRDAAFEAGEIPQIVIDSSGTLLLANQPARQLFKVEEKDLGRPLQDLELSYRPIEVRSLVERCYSERKPITVENVEKREANGQIHYIDVQVTPLEDNAVLLGAAITFKDVTRYHLLEEEAQKARQEAETVNEELEAANEELQSTNEELETTNEELQSTNEELETTNEELQSTNEELETMNEELQSTNEELQTMNEELRLRTDELNVANAFLSSILTSLRAGVVVVDKNLTILIWNSIAEEMWGLRADEVKTCSLFNLDIGLPVNQLRDPIRTALNDGDGAQDLILDAVNRRGRNIKCRVSVGPFKAANGERQGAVIMMEEMGM
jgi:two-component system, chemotaxis family, CheB/CheR fusion protein